jgi:hypothetical protein
MIRPLLLTCFFIVSTLVYGQSFDWLKTGFRTDCNNGVYPRDVTSSPNGSVTSTGYFYAPSANVEFDGQTLTQNGTGFSSDVYIANYDDAGTIQWLEKIGTNQSDGTYPRVDTDGNDNIYVGADLAGTTGGSTGSAAGIALTNVYPNDAVLVKLNSSGTAQWAQHITDATGDVEIRDIEVTNSGDIYVTGSFSGSISVDETTQTADGDNFFVAKFDTDGTLMWWRNSTGANSDIGYRVTVKGNNVYVLGQMAQGNVNTSMTVNGNTNSLTAGDDRAHFLVKYNDAGTFDWFEYGYLENTGFGSGIFPYYCDVVVDDNDEIYTIHTATAESQASANYIYPGTSVTYNTIANTSGNGQSNYIITKYNSSGVAQWARGDGTSTTGSVFPTEMILHSDSKLVVTNIMSGTTELDNVSFTSAGSDDMIIAQFDLEAGLICSQQYGGTNQDWAMALDENPDGTCAYAGHVFGGTSEAVITTYDGIDLSGCRNTSVTGTFATTSVSAEFSFVTYPSAEVCQPDANCLILSGNPSGYNKSFISSPSGLTINGTSGEIDVNASTPGTYLVSHILSDGSPCGTDTVTKTFTINEAPTSNAGNDFSVCGTSGSLNGNVPNTGTGTWSITSGPAGANIVDANDPASNLTGLSEGTYTVEWSVTNSCSTVTSDVTITVNTVPQILTNGDQEVCDGEEITLNATASAGTISWNNAVTNNTPFTPNATDTYTVTVDNNGCTATEDVLVTVNDLPTVTIGNDQTICVNDEPIILSGTPVGGNFSGTGVIGSEFDPGSAGEGTHIVTYIYQDGNGCENSATQVFTVEKCASLNEEQAGFNLYPNPAHTYFEIESTYAIEEVKVISALGQEVNSLPIEMLGQNKIKVTTINLNRGTYFVQIKTANDVFTQKVIIH